MTLITLFLSLFSICSAPSLSVQAQKENIESIMKRIEYEQQFALFVADLGHRESNNNWQVINQIGCMGKFQFSPNTLEYLGYGHITPQRFAQDPNIFPEELQYQILCALLKSNLIALKDYMSYIGVTIGGVEVTKSGLLAACHLGGAGSVKLYLLTNGGINKKDCNQTSIKTYMREFAGYKI